MGLTGPNFPRRKIMTNKTIALLMGLLISLNTVAVADELKIAEDKSIVVWTQGMDIEDFWSKYAASKGGLTWGKSSSYPDYDKVIEGDTLLIELKQGNCLMEFFHSRWRRANDVWRWDEMMNLYGGCPYVFD